MANLSTIANQTTMSPAIVFTLVSLISASLAILVTSVSTVILINHLRHTRDVVLLLLTNTYITIFLFSFLVLLINAKVIEADLNGFTGLTNNQLTACQVEGFFIFLAFGLCYMSFVAQAFYRFVRVLYPKHKFLQAFSFNLICIGLTWILYTLILLPSYFWPGGFLYTLFPLDYYCGIAYDKSSGLLYTVFMVYPFPIVCLSILYARLVYYIRYQIPQTAQSAHARRAQRDFLVIRRILFIVNVLTLPGLPNVVFVIITTVHPSVSGLYHMYRVQWMFPAVFIFMLSIALPIMTPQLKHLIMNKLFNVHARVDPAQQLPMWSLTQTRLVR